MVLQEIKESLGTDYAGQNNLVYKEVGPRTCLLTVRFPKKMSVHHLLAGDGLLQGEVDVGELSALKPPPGHQLRQGRLKGGRCAVCSVHCAVCSVRCTVCSAQCAVCSVQCAVHSVQFAVFSVQCAVCSVQCAVHSVQ